MARGAGDLVAELMRDECSTIGDRRGSVGFIDEHVDTIDESVDDRRREHGERHTWVQPAVGMGVTSRQHSSALAAALAALEKPAREPEAGARAGARSVAATGLREPGRRVL